MNSPPFVLYRLGNLLFKMRIPLIPKIISWVNRLIFGCWVPSSATIGKNVTLAYWGLGIVIHSECTLGDNILIGQNVTIGRNKKDPGVPQIGNQVYIGAGSVVSGNITIGDGAIIGANAFVNRSVAAKTVVAGAPAKFIRDTKTGEVEKLVGLASVEASE